MSKVIFLLIFGTYIQHFSYEQLISMFENKLKNTFKKEIALRKMTFEENPEIHFNVYLPVKNYSKNITFFPGYSMPILLENSNTRYGFNLSMNHFFSLFDLNARVEGYDNQYNSNVYLPAHQRNLYAGIGIKKAFFKPDKNKISFLADNVKKMHAYWTLLKKKKEHLYEFKKNVLSYLLYREKLKRTSRLMNRITEIYSIIQDGWKKKLIGPDKYFDTRILYLSVLNELAEDSLNYSLSYKTIKDMLDIKDTFDIREDFLSVSYEDSLKWTKVYKKDIEFISDSLRILLEYYRTLMDCSEKGPGALFEFEIGGERVMTGKGEYRNLFPSVVNIGVTLSFLPYGSMRCEKLAEEELSLKMLNARKDLLLRNKKRNHLLKNYKNELKKYRETIYELEKVIFILTGNGEIGNYNNIRKYIEMYNDFTLKLFDLYLKVEKIRSEFP